MLSLEQIKILYNLYNQLLKFEIEKFECKPIELRHLISRLGEFYCVLHVKGSMAKETNQHGFDVIAPDKRKIRVKTTVQKSGFFEINKHTLDKVDDLMLLQYRDGKIEQLYYGPINKIENSILKVKRLSVF